MTQTLEQAAKQAGLQDMDLLRLAPEGVKPSLAIADLQHRYPAAFLKHVRDMTPAEFKAAEAKLLQPLPRAPLPDNLRKHVDDMTLTELEAFERYHGIQVSGGESRRRQEMRAEHHRRREIGF